MSVSVDRSANCSQFYHELKEYLHWMPLELDKAQVKVVYSRDMTGSRKEAEILLLNLKEVLGVFLYWEGKVDNLWERSKKIIPVNQRVEPCDYIRTISILCDYKTKQISLTEGEEVTLMNNSNAQNWQIRSLQGSEAEVPSVICLIPGPDPSAVESAVKLRLRLLGVWTTNVKIIGKTIIKFLLLIFKEFKENEKKMLKAMPDKQKKDVAQTIDYITSVMSPYWNGFLGYERVKKQFSALTTVLAERGDAKDNNAKANEIFIMQMMVVRDLLTAYKDFWRYWETFKVLVETSKHADYILICEEWEQLKFIDRAELTKLWQLRLGWGPEDELDFAVEEEIVEESTEEMVATEQVTTSELEEKRTFVITGVIDPRSQEEISMQQAVMLGVINSQNGTYVNPATGETYPIPVAMNAGFIKVEYTTTKKSAEKKKDIGIITIKTQKEVRPYTVKAVMDAKTDRKISVEEAVNNAMLDQKKGTYKNTATGEVMSLADALDCGLIEVEYDKSAPGSEPEIVTLTYSIHGVIDQKSKNKVTFSEAVAMGILNKDSGTYVNNITGEKVYVADAIKKGFIKATVVKDPSSLDIDTNNKIVVDRLDAIKEKIIKPMKVAAALKKAGAAVEEEEAKAQQNGDKGDQAKPENPEKQPKSEKEKPTKKGAKAK